MFVATSEVSVGVRHAIFVTLTIEDATIFLVSRALLSVIEFVICLLRFIDQMCWISAVRIGTFVRDGQNLRTKSGVESEGELLSMFLDTVARSLFLFVKEFLKILA